MESVQTPRRRGPSAAPLQLYYVVSIAHGEPHSRRNLFSRRKRSIESAALVWRPEEAAAVGLEAGVLPPLSAAMIDYDGALRNRGLRFSAC